MRDLFLDICRSWGRVAPTLSAMHELGLLGRYLPEFGALTCLVQYDVYHKFSADQHSLLAVSTWRRWRRASRRSPRAPRRSSTRWSGPSS